MFSQRPGKWVSTGKSDPVEAETWAIEHRLDPPPDPVLTLRAFTVDFFIPGKCRWIVRRKKKAARRGRGRKKSRKLPGAPTLKSYRGILVNYILPRWGDYLLSYPTARMLDDWLLDLVDYRTGEELKGQTKNHILQVLRILYQEAMDSKLIGSNPAAEIEPFDNDWESPDILEDEELLALFPVDRDKLLAIWRSQMWLTYFRTLSESGKRPSEILALRWRDWHRSLHGLEFRRTVEDGGRIKDELKTRTKTGDFAVALLTDQGEQELLLWEAACKWTEPDDLIFCATRGKPLQRRGYLEVFRDALKAAKVEPGSRRIVPYSMRHGLNTDLLKKLPIEVVQILMGHRTDEMSRLYNHPMVGEVLQAVQPVRPLLEERWKRKEG